MGIVDAINATGDSTLLGTIKNKMYGSSRSGVSYSDVKDIKVSLSDIKGIYNRPAIN
jgi:hypothetical protein